MRFAALLTLIGVGLFLVGVVLSPVPWLALCLVGASTTVVGLLRLEVQQ